MYVRDDTDGDGVQRAIPDELIAWVFTRPLFDRLKSFVLGTRLSCIVLISCSLSSLMVVPSTGVSYLFSLYSAVFTHIWLRRATWTESVAKKTLDIQEVNIIVYVVAYRECPKICSSAGSIVPGHLEIVDTAQRPNIGVDNLSCYSGSKGGWALLATFLPALMILKSSFRSIVLKPRPPKASVSYPASLSFMARFWSSWAMRSPSLVKHSPTRSLHPQGFRSRLNKI